MSAADLELERVESAVKRDDLDGALEQIEAVLASEREPIVRAKALSWRGHIASMRADPTAAIVDYEAALRETPDAPWLHYALGTALHTSGAVERSVLAYSRAIELDPEHIKAYQWRGYSYELLENQAAAIADYSKALELLEAADEATLRGWGADRDKLIRWTLAQRAVANEAAGNKQAASADRERLELLGAAR